MKRKIGVLIVDDEVLVRIGIIHAVAWEENGFEIIGEASDGESCLQMARKYQPDLIVLDINMPGMNGLQVLNRLKEEGYSGKVIMLTCYEEFEYVREALRGGADDYVLKSNLNESSILSAILRLDFNRRPEEEEPQNRKMMARKISPAENRRLFLRRDARAYLPYLLFLCHSRKNQRYGKDRKTL